jgi:Membrane carboxypeptidase (penicillin-binding protein)
MVMKIIGVFVIIIAIAIFGIFSYFKKDLDAIRPGELAKRVQSTVNRYEDRYGKLLWEDKGDGNYKLVVEGSEISTYMRQATVAIEDKDFYNHRGVSLWALARSAINNLQGGSTQGGSTLTQQLIKQVYFSDESEDRSMGGIPRKIKEMILAVEIERMYDKEQIITLYLNESPYGGRRNGVESGARTYFGKASKDLNLSESALLAAIPNNPAVLNPYNIEMNDLLIERQHKVLDDMVSAGFITQKECDEAKQIAILDTIKPEESQYAGIKAPHFVLEVKKQLEAEFGVKTVRNGGLTIRTTLDYEAQKVAEKAVKEGASIMHITGADNIALTSIDVETAQIIAMVGSVNYNKAGYGQTNAAVSPLEPGSSIKPIVDYAPLFKQRPGVNYGPGSILRDENIDAIYCAGNVGPCTVNNATRQTFGNITIRKSLAGSLNRPAIKAMYIAGIQESIKTARDLGDLNYCKANGHAGLSSAIGGGCSVLVVEHTNAYASLARGGVYKPYSYILEVKNSSDEVIKKWEDTPGKQAVDPQVAYMISNILSDHQARTYIFGGMTEGFVIPGVWTATKTGTTENGRGSAKDSWMMSYSPVIATGVWTGVHDGSPLLNDGHNVASRVTAVYMENVHKKVYGSLRKKWKEGNTIRKPNGIKTMTINGQTDIWPSWATNTNTGITKEKMMFDKISKRKATDCTPESTKIEISVEKIIDPITKKITYLAGGYDAQKSDHIHQCGDALPAVSISVFTNSNGDTVIQVLTTPGASSRPVKTYTISVDGNTVNSGSMGGSDVEIIHVFEPGAHSLSARVVDSAGYENTGTGSYTQP